MLEEVTSGHSALRTALQSKLCPAAVGGVIAVVPDEEEMPRWHGVDQRVIPGARADIQDRMAGTAWQGLDELFLLAITAFRNHRVAPGQIPNRPLVFVGLREHTIRGLDRWCPVNVKDTALHLHFVAGQADHALNEI